MSDVSDVSDVRRVSEASTVKKNPWRFLIWAGISLVLLFMAVLALISTFLATEGGSRLIAQWGLEQFAEVEGVDISVGEIRGNLLQGLQFSEIDLNTPQVSVQAQSLTADWNAFSLFTADFQLERFYLESITVTVEDSASDDDAQTGPLSSPVSNLEFASLPIGIEIGQFRLVGLTLISGPAEGQQSTDIGRIEAGITLRGTRVVLSDLTVDSEIAALTGRVSAELTAGLPLEASVHWEFAEALPANLGNASGDLTLGGSLEQLQINHRLLSPFSIASDGSVEPFNSSGPTIDLQHSAQRIVLPEQVRAAELRQVAIGTRGTISELQFSLDARVEDAEYPPFTLAAEGQVINQLVSLTGEITTLNGMLQSSLELDISAGIAARGEFSLSEDDPLVLLGMNSDIPLTHLTSAGQFQFSSSDEELALDLELGPTTATLDGYEVTAAGGISLRNSAWAIDDFVLRSAANQLRVSGSYDETVALDWELQAPELEQFVPGVSAVAMGEGTLRGSLESPIVDARFTVDSLTTGSASVRSLQFSLSGDVDFYEGQIEIEGARLDASSEPLEFSQGTVLFSGSPLDHELSMDLQGDFAGSELSADFDLQGGFVAGFDSAWQGRLTRGDLRSAAGEWLLDSPSELSWSGQQFTAEDSCWSYAGIQICLNVAPGTADGYVAEGSVSSFPLQELNPVEQRQPLMTLAQIPRLPAGVDFEGEMNATVFAEFGGTTENRFVISTSADNAVLTLRSGVQDEFGAQRNAEEILAQSYTWRRLSLRADYQQGQWAIDGRAQLNTANLQDSNLSLTGELTAQLNIDEEGKLEGSTVAEFSDLGWLSAIVPEMRDVSGLLESRLAIAGDLTTPELSGELRINEASFFLERTAVAYSDIELSLVGTSASAFNLEGSVVSDDGYLTYSGSVDGLNSAGWQLLAEVEGDNFAVSNTPDLVLEISPALNLDANAQRIALRGNLHVPLLNLLLQELPESAVDISRDVVISNYPGESPELARTFTSNQTAVFDLPMSADLVLTLGDEVAFTGFGLQASLAGELEVQQQLSGSSFTYGELAITEGSYRIYGQELTLQNGKLLFLGNYANPALDIRAVREVESQTVGVLINGTLNNMRSQLFSTPVLPQSDILAVLVTGRPASQLRSSDGDAMIGAIASLGIEQGQSLAEDLGSRLGFDSVAITNTGNINSSELTVGKYLTPQVFIRYGVGLFDSFSKVAVDYFINDRLTLQAESGQYQSIDFTYRVER